MNQDIRRGVIGPSEIARAEDAEEAFVGGRVVAIAFRAATIADAFGHATIELADASAVAVADLVVLAGAIEGGAMSRARVVARHRPSVRAETQKSDAARFHRDDLAARLVARSRALAAVRDFFAARAFLEVQTPSIVPSPGLDLHLDAFAVEGAGYLTTSPEVQMKRLLTGGVMRCFQLARCFRKGELGSRHTPEFTMIEWYRAFAGVDDVMADTEALVKHVARAVGDGALHVEGRAIDLEGSFERVTLAEAFERYARVSKDEMIDLATNDEDRFFRLLVEKVEPELERVDVPVFVTEYPAPFASLARLSPSDPRVAERFELYAGGVELCNGFGELTDPFEQRARFERDRRERARRGLPIVPIDERFLFALEEGMPPSAGNALGFDRLLALAIGARSIADVQTFPPEWLT